MHEHAQEVYKPYAMLMKVNMDVLVRMIKDRKQLCLPWNLLRRLSALEWCFAAFWPEKDCGSQPECVDFGDIGFTASNPLYLEMIMPRVRPMTTRDKLDAADKGMEEQADVDAQARLKEAGEGELTMQPPESRAKPQIQDSASTGAP